MTLRNEFILWLLENKLDHIAGSILLNNIEINYEKYIEINNDINFNIKFNIKNNDDFNKVAPDGCEFMFINNKWGIKNISTKQIIQLTPYKELNSKNAKEAFDFIISTLKH